MNTDKIKNILAQYKTLLSENGGLAGRDELFKWQRITNCCVANFTNLADFIQHIPSINCTHLLYHYSEKTIKKYFCAVAPQKYEIILNELFDETNDIDYRIEQYIESSKNLFDKIGDSSVSSHQDERTAATLLTLNNPVDYTFYKNTMYRNFCKAMDVEIKSTKCYSHFLTLMQELIPYIKADTELCNIIANETKSLTQSDLLIAQDIAYQLFDRENPFREKCYFVCSVGEPGKDYSNDNLKKCIEKVAHIMHSETMQKGAFDKVESGDIIFLKYERRIIAYGVVTTKSKDDKDDNGWDYYINVSKWHFYSSTSTQLGVGRYSIAENTITGSKYATIKEIKANFAMNWLQEFKDYHLLNMDKQVLEYINLLKNNKNIILTGVPGTGKTYLAKKIIAQEIVGYADNGHIEFVQFHPSYDYTDFVEGLRAEKVGATMGGVTFTLRNGIFKSFCKRALNNPDENYVFIIDEINRGDMSKIFGELFFSIDPSYRGVDGKVKTQYENLHTEDTIFDEELGAGWFYIPDNVYIIGTMNDIDRSVESMDFAMRRRFTWVEVTAEERASMLDGNNWAEEAKEKMAAINKVIEKIDGLGSAYHIGPAYFLKLESYKYQEESQMWDSLWKYHIYPLLSEYLRGMPNADEELTKLEAAYRNPKATVTNESQEN